MTIDLDIIREAGKKKVLLLIRAKEKDGSIETREVEPYSFREKRGWSWYRRDPINLFYFWDPKKGGHIRSFKIENILFVKLTDKPFKPRFEVEVHEQIPK